MIILLFFVGNIGKNKMICILQNKEFFTFCRNPEKKDSTQFSIYKPQKILYPKIYGRKAKLQKSKRRNSNPQWKNLNGKALLQR